MDEQQALAAIEQALARTIDDPPAITRETDLVEEEILDSLDGMSFLLELEQLTGAEFPEEGDLVELGFYRVGRLVEHLTSE